MKRAQFAKHRCAQRLLTPLIGFLSVCISAVGHTAPFPDFPLQTGTGSIPPNIMFVLDDSGSMAAATMPATTYYINTEARDTPWRRSYVNNTIYYNPAVDYLPWMQSTGIRMQGGTTYEAVYADPLYVGDGVDTINLKDPTSCVNVVANSTAVTICGGGLSNINDTNVQGDIHTYYVPKLGLDNHQLCDANDTCGTSSDYYKFTILTNGEIWRTEFRPGDGRFWRGEAVRATPQFMDEDGVLKQRSEEDERNNYAAWFSYHRTRMKAAKAGASEAFAQLGSRYRVGYDTIWREGNGLSRVSNNIAAESADPVFRIPVSNDDGLFTGENRDKWFGLLHNARAFSGTPLRRALTRTGNYYMSEGADSPWGPGPVSEQLSCRQSYAIITSDGHWNSSTPSIVENSKPDVDSAEGDEITSADGTRSFRYDPEDPGMPYADTRKGTLADVAMYYWKQDLQPQLANNVPTSSRNPAFWQHMSTFAISIGLGGTVDQASVSEVLEQGVTVNGVSQTRWPNPMDVESDRRIDDMLHAAVNGRGEFVAASNPQEFASALQNSLAAITATSAAGASVASNGPSLNSESMLFQATYVSGEWSGDLVGVSIAGGAINDCDDVSCWSMADVAQEDRSTFAQRNVWTTGLDGTPGSFPRSDQIVALERDPDLPRGVSGEDNAKYIKGSAVNEGQGLNQLRRRKSPIGTIVNSSPFYVGEIETVFVGANDGMLHAVNALNGEVRFSYVPRGLDFSRLAEISSQDYQHTFFVDGGIDVTTRGQSGGLEKNVLVASLGRGGKGLFGLDVTNPDAGTAAQLVKWDASFQGEGSGQIERNTGHILGAPLVRRGNNGQLLAIYGNGYYSATGSATLFIRNAETGAVLRRIEVDSTGENGLGEVRAADLDGNGTADVLYAADLKGNVWKFDVSSNRAQNWGAAGTTGNTTRPFFTATDPSGNPQPITSAVALARDPSVTGGGRIFVVFGTGSYMIPSDLQSTQTQTLYAVVDSSDKNKVRQLDRDDLEQREITQSGVDELGRPARSWEPFSDLESENGWFVDLGRPTAGERVISAPVVRGRALWFASVIPKMGSGCEVGGTGYLNAVDVFTGTNPGRPDGSTYSFIDVNDDGEGDDYLSGASAGNDGLVTSVDVGIGMPSQPTFVDDDVYAAGSEAKLGRLPGLPVGKQPARLRWHELVGEE